MEQSQQSAKSKMNGTPASASTTASSLFSQESVEQLSQSVNDMTDRVKAAADTAVSESLSFAKKYPVHTALGAIAVGFVIGFFARSGRSNIKK